MTERTKVYTLPDILPAPHSDVGAMARTLIEYADLSVVPALLDELDRVSPFKAQRFREELAHLGSSCLRIVEAQYIGTVPRWQWAVDVFVRLFWFDLFDLVESMAQIETAVTKEEFVNPIPEASLTPPGQASAERRWRAAQDIQAGQYIILRYFDPEAVLAEDQNPSPVEESQQDE